MGHHGDMTSGSDAPMCRRCGRPVEVSRSQYDTFEQMHYVCFHYEFEHDPADPDEECSAGECPSASVNPRPDRRPVTRLAARELLRSGKSPTDVVKALRGQGLSLGQAKAVVDDELPLAARVANDQLRNQAVEALAEDE